jgi:hypothetical protein
MTGMYALDTGGTTKWCFSWGARLNRAMRFSEGRKPPGQSMKRMPQRGGVLPGRGGMPSKDNVWGS